jgi:nitrite reductase/ring-hydroxylating ferredoxin subunit
MGLLRRIFGISETRPPSDPGCWKLDGGRIVVDLGRAPELSAEGGALRIEGRDIGRRLLVVHGVDGAFHAFENRCTHGGRRLDPLPGRGEVRCCSVGRSTFDYEGRRVSGAATDPIRVLDVEQDGDRLLIPVR